MKSIVNLSNEQKITLATLISSLIFLYFVGFNEFKNNYLNYATVLSFAGSIFFLKTFLFTALQSEVHLKNKNWFSFGLDILLAFSQIWLLIQGIRLLNQTSDPLNTVWYLFISSIIFFVQVYITKQIKIFPALIVEAIILAILSFLLRIINIYTPENQVYLLIQVGVSYITFFVSIYVYFFMLKKLIE
jgi:hypothetical protein